MVLVEESDITLSDDKKVLEIDVNDVEGNAPYMLRPRTLYKVTLEEGAVRFKDYTNIKNDDSTVTLDLDELIGQDVITRRIRYKANRKDDINKLKTSSKWVNINFTNLRNSSDKRNDELEICVGKAEPYLTQMLKDKLKGQNIKSEFINISGENFLADFIEVSIPYKESNGDNLIALRYDESARRWEEEHYTIDVNEKRVNILTNSTGIFVIIEEKDN